MPTKKIAINSFDENKKYIIGRAIISPDPNKNPRFGQNDRIIVSGKQLITKFKTYNLEELLEKNPNHTFQSNQEYSAYIVESTEEGKEKLIYFDKATSPIYESNTNNTEHPEEILPKENNKEISQQEVKNMTEFTKTLGDIFTEQTKPQMDEIIRSKDATIDALRKQLDDFKEMQENGGSASNAYLEDVIERYKDEITDLREDLRKANDTIIKLHNDQLNEIINLKQDKARLEEKAEYQMRRYDDLLKRIEEQKLYQKEVDSEAQKFINTEIENKMRGLQDDIRAKEDQYSVVNALLSNLPQTVTAIKEVFNMGGNNNQQAQQQNQQPEQQNLPQDSMFLKLKYLLSELNVQLNDLTISNFATTLKESGLTSETLTKEILEKYLNNNE